MWKTLFLYNFSTNIMARCGGETVSTFSLTGSFLFQHNHAVMHNTRSIKKWFSNCVYILITTLTLRQLFGEGTLLFQHLHPGQHFGIMPKSQASPLNISRHHYWCSCSWTGGYCRSQVPTSGGKPSRTEWRLLKLQINVFTNGSYVLVLTDFWPRSLIAFASQVASQLQLLLTL